MKIRSVITEEPITWIINTDEFTLEEKQEYIESVSFGSDIKILTSITTDHNIVVNGIGTQLPTADYKSMIGAYSHNDGDPVSCFNYFPDRGLVEAEYFNHPLDSAIPNTFHDDAEFITLIETMFNAWKIKTIEDIADMVITVNEVPTVTNFNPTGDGTK